MLRHLTLKLDSGRNALKLRQNRVARFMDFVATIIHNDICRQIKTCIEHSLCVFSSSSQVSRLWFMTADDHG